MRHPSRHPCAQVGQNRRQGAVAGSGCGCRQLELQLGNRRHPTSAGLPRLTACSTPIATPQGDNMTQWYYADAQRQRQGPVDTDTLAARLSQGIIDRSSLVWREGLPQWVALHEVAAELGLDHTVSAAAQASGPTRVDAPVDAPPPAASLQTVRRPCRSMTTLPRHRTGPWWLPMLAALPVLVIPSPTVPIALHRSIPRCIRHATQPHRQIRRRGPSHRQRRRPRHWPPVLA